MARVTRLAPSPTGALHLGNARTFLVNWLLARQNGWKVVLRIEDLDGPRIKPGADQQAMEDLAWLGIDWDEGPIYQSARTSTYEAAVQQLLKSKHAYYCTCTRKEVSSAASAPHAEDGAAIYPGTCRGMYSTREEAIRATEREPAVRFEVNDTELSFHDEFAGKQIFNPQSELGDFVIQKADRTAAYQLSVVVDDAAAGVTNVVRGDDLIDSTPRQMLLYRAMGMAEKIPAYAHLPLVVGEDGKRLAKRHGDTRLATYREAGISSNRLLALLARWCGLPNSSEISIDELLNQFQLEIVPRPRIVFTKQDDDFLKGFVS